MLWRIIGMVLAALFYAGMWTFIVIEQRADKRSRKELVDAIMERGRIVLVLHEDVDEPGGAAVN